MKELLKNTWTITRFLVTLAFLYLVVIVIAPVIVGTIGMTFFPVR